MRKPHVHAELIKAWADGAEIQAEQEEGIWEDILKPSWTKCVNYRIKPEPKPDTMRTYSVQWDINNNEIWWHYSAAHNLKLTFDGETGKLKSAEVI